MSGEVDAWCIELDAPAAESGRLLDATERDRAASYLSALDGARFAASRAGLRCILGRYLGTDPAELQFGTDPGGRPVLAGQLAHDGLQFSLSRSGSVALAAVSTGPVGADVEALVARDGLADLAAARFSPAEAACIAWGACAGSPVRSFYRHWTAREAWLKASGAGVAALRDIEFDCTLAPRVRFLSARRAVPDLELQLLDFSPGHVAAVVATGPVTICRWLSSGLVSQ